MKGDVLTMDAWAKIFFILLIFCALAFIVFSILTNPALLGIKVRP